MTKPGLHGQFRMERFGDREGTIIHGLARRLFVTYAGRDIRLANSKYSWFLMKPTGTLSEMFNITREVIVVFSPYSDLQPRSLDAFDAAQAELSELRAEPVCRILISDDRKVEEKISNLLRTGPEQPIVIPFTYRELQGHYDEYFLVNRFRVHFYERDLFSFRSPLKKDLYFFGRSQLLQELVNKYRAGEHGGLFGLRKSGKTSIIYAIERHLKSHNMGPIVSFDCESPGIHGLRWFELLEKLVVMYRDANESKYSIAPGRYTERTAPDCFAEDVLGVFRSKKRRKLLILFDEIERISTAYRLLETLARWR